MIFLRKSLLLSFVYFGSVLCIDFDLNAYKTWDSISAPRQLSQAISFSRTDNETVRPIAEEAIQKLNRRTPKDISILWVGREAFRRVDDVISFKCASKIQELKRRDFSNYWIGSMLLRSQTDDTFTKLIDGFDIEIVMAGISLLENEKNGKKKEAKDILTKIKPAMKKIGREIFIDD